MISGSLGVLWTGLWLLLVTNNPASHPRITEAEKIYIRDSISHKEKNTVQNKLIIKTLTDLSEVNI